MGHQVPTYREKIPPRADKKIKELLKKGNNKDAIKLILAMSSANHPNVDLIAMVALAKAMEMSKELGMKRITERASAGIIKYTPASYVVQEAIRWAKKKVDKDLDEKEMMWVTSGLLPSIIEMFNEAE